MMLARAVLGVVLGVVARIWLATLRLDVQMDKALRLDDDAPWVLVFFHGTQWPLLAWKRRRVTSVMVSLSADGAMQTRALGLLGLRVHRGSSSRGGARGLASVIRDLRRGRDAAFAVDGPRGPYGIAKPGAIVAASRSDARLVPMGAACAHAKRFARAWDHFTLAWPFSRVAVVLGAPLDASQITEKTLSMAIADANASAVRRLASMPAS